MSFVPLKLNRDPIGVGAWRKGTATLSLVQLYVGVLEFVAEDVVQGKSCRGMFSVSSSIAEDASGDQ